MSPVFVTRRRAEEFDAALAARSTEAAGEGRYDDLLALVGALRAVPQPEPRADFVADLRSRLLAEAATLPAPNPADAEADRLRLRPADPGRPRRPRERRVSLALGGLALVGATATLSVVAQSALPGDTLYPLKRGIESAHADLSVSEGGKGSTLLSSASTRLDEVSQLDPQQQPTEIADTLDDFTEQASQASDLLLGQYEQDGDQANVTKVRTFAESSMKSLADLGGTLPPEAQDEWVHAVTTLVRIDDEAALTCPTCAGTDLDAVTPTCRRSAPGSAPGILPAVNLPYLGPGLVLPSVDATGLPPGSVTKPSPTAGPGAGPTGQPTGRPTGGPTSAPPTGGPTGEPTSASPTGAQPTSALPTVLPSVGVSGVIDTLTSGPSLPIPLPSVGVTQLLGGVGSALPTAVTSPLDDLLP